MPPKTDPDSDITIYSLTDPRTHAVHYIGQTIDPDRRLSSHLRATEQMRCAKWVLELRVAGLTPSLSVLEVVSGQAAANEAERKWIATGRASGWPLLNTASGGERWYAGIAAANRGKKMSASAVAKATAARRARPILPQQKARVSVSLKAHYSANPHPPMSEATKAKISRTKSGKPSYKRTPDQRAAISIRLKGQPGRKKSDDEKARIAAAIRARNAAYSPEMRAAVGAKISRSKMGHVVTQETRDKISATKLRNRLAAGITATA